MEAIAENNEKDPATSENGNGTSGDPDIRFFDADESGQIQQLRDSKEFGEISGGLDAEIEKTINELEAQMESTIEMLNRMEEEGDPDKAEELRKQFKKTLRDQYKGRIGLEAEDYKLLHVPGFGSRIRSVAALNRFLARESIVKGGVPKRKDLLECWKSYSAARKTLSACWDKVPREVWDFLWTMMSWEGIENPNRMRHVYILTKDMTAAGIPLRSSQQLLAIEAMFIEGWQDEAVESWKKAVVTLGSKPESFIGYWELGVRMFCLRGETDRAQRAVDTLLKSEHEADPRILLPLIRALALQEDKQPQAWEAYQRLSSLLRSNIKIEDYDDVISSFLTANRIENALQVFVDMMFSRAIDIRGKKILPISVGNHFFIGKWLKRLIGAGDLDGAYKAVAFLRTKGVVPSPIQLNGLIGAWLRSGKSQNLEKAERLAWDMIRSRLSWVQIRRRKHSNGNIFFYDPVKHSNTDLSDGSIKMGTRASIETFCILAENYSTRGLHNRLKELLDVLEQAELPTTSFIMNQVMKSYTTANKPQEAIDFYREMTLKRAVHPDPHTFLALLGTLTVNRVVVIDEATRDEDLPRAREFFKELVDTDWKFDSLPTFHFFPRYVLFTFFKTQDYTGMMVAARAMRALFDFIPQESLLIELAAGATNLRVSTDANVERIAAASKIVSGFIMSYRKRMGRMGVNMDQPTTEQRAEELSTVLERVILVKADAADADGGDVEGLLRETAREMGLYEIVFGGDEEAIRKRRKIFGNHVYRVGEGEGEVGGR